MFYFDAERLLLEVLSSEAVINSTADPASGPRKTPDPVQGLMYIRCDTAMAEAYREELYIVL